MTPQQEADIMLADWQKLTHVRCHCGDRMTRAEADRGICDPCAGVPSSRPEPVAKSLLGTLLVACLVGLLFVVAGALS